MDPGRTRLGKKIDRLEVYTSLCAPGTARLVFNSKKQFRTKFQKKGPFGNTAYHVTTHCIYRNTVQLDIDDSQVDGLKPLQHLLCHHQLVVLNNRDMT